MIVRDATLSDRIGVLACWRALYESVESEGGMQARPEQQQTLLLAAFDAIVEGSVDGVCLVVGTPVQAFTMWAVADPELHPKLKRYAEALATYVSPTLRGKRVASTLYGEARLRLRRLRVDSLVALTETTNKPAQELLRSQGFTAAQIVYTAPLGRNASEESI